ncbi:hypothetical protein LK542_17525 [Massilia sp. IC2-477]|nr:MULTISPECIES: hypothetical protein [unclassified Massilia]MCC2957420.1 hypothetical protein [Massilia sp. IC2-477]MCC2973886.1 hypothetical protein [Massilia sp. IC2-476]
MTTATIVSIRPEAPRTFRFPTAGLAAKLRRAIELYGAAYLVKGASYL